MDREVLHEYLGFLFYMKDRLLVKEFIRFIYITKNIKKLVLAYGVSETYLAHQQWAVPKEAVTINTYFEKFDIVPERYGESYVFKVYDTSQKLRL